MLTFWSDSEKLGAGRMVAKLNEYLNQTGAASYLGISRGTLRSWVKKGIGPPVKKSPTGRPLYDPADLDWFLEGIEDK